MRTFASALLLASAVVAQVRYDNFEVHRVVPSTPEQIKALKDFENNPNGFSFWTDIVAAGVPVDIMVPPHLKYNFQDMVELLRLNDSLWIENVQARIDGELPKMRPRSFGWRSYHNGEEINAWLQQLEQDHGEVTRVVGGRSYEGRDIVGIKINYGANKPAVILEGGIHAREWIAPATVTYMINEILNNKDSSVRQIVEQYNWHIFPSVNPDGYAYTHSHDRMWRKTRKPYGSCYGADPNRNWDFHWGEAGVSNNPCYDTFAGSNAFSEIEAASFSQYISRIKNIEAYIAFHSYSQFLLIPYGHTNEKLDNYRELKCIGDKAATSLAKRYGTSYKVGNIVDVIYPASGGSMDWVKGTHGARITYTYELRDQGRYGFILPPNLIIPTAEETLDSVLTILNEANSGSCPK